MDHGDLVVLKFDTARGLPIQTGPVLIGLPTTGESSQGRLLALSFSWISSSAFTLSSKFYSLEQVFLATFTFSAAFIPSSLPKSTNLPNQQQPPTSPRKSRPSARQLYENRGTQYPTI